MWMWIVWGTGHALYSAILWTNVKPHRTELKWFLVALDDTIVDGGNAGHVCNYLESEHYI